MSITKQNHIMATDKSEKKEVSVYATLPGNARGALIRTYSEAEHGPNYRKLAEMFAGKPSVNGILV